MLRSAPCLAGRLSNVNTRKAWTIYILLRLLFFAVPFALLVLLLNSWGWPYWPTALLSTAIAALVSVSLSVIFLSKPRDIASESIYAWRHRDRTADDVVEDDALDAAGSGPEGSRVEDRADPREQ